MQCQEAAARPLLSDTLDYRGADLKAIPWLKIKKEEEAEPLLSVCVLSAIRDARLPVDIISSDMLIAPPVAVF